MKKILLLFLAAMLAVGMTACKSNDNGNNTDSGKDNTQNSSTTNGDTGEFDCDWIELPIDKN